MKLIFLRKIFFYKIVYLLQNFNFPCYKNISFATEKNNFAIKFSFICSKSFFFFLQKLIFSATKRFFLLQNLVLCATNVIFSAPKQSEWVWPLQLYAIIFYTTVFKEIENYIQQWNLLRDMHQNLISTNLRCN